jgi:hypothetical protein
MRVEKQRGPLPTSVVKDELCLFDMLIFLVDFACHPVLSHVHISAESASHTS